ncbi:NUDIX domain-containing protein [Kitasatospora sp. NPDC094028]
MLAGRHGPQERSAGSRPPWEMLGGGVEWDESPKAGAVREVKEELGLSVVVGRLLGMDWVGPRPDRSGHRRRLRRRGADGRAGGQDPAPGRGAAADRGHHAAPRRTAHGQGTPLPCSR